MSLYFFYRRLLNSNKNVSSISSYYLIFIVLLIANVCSVQIIKVDSASAPLAQNRSYEVDVDYSDSDADDYPHIDLNATESSYLVDLGLDDLISISDEELEDENRMSIILGLRSKCNFPAKDEEDTTSDYYLSTTELLEREGFEAETHYVTSEDGYTVEIHRIPAPGKPVVYALHGIFQSSRDFLMNCEGRALAHKLFNSGYDVWLGNIRGNSYAQNHSTLSPKSWAFWTWGIDEVSMYDLPATVDYILKVTHQPKLNYIGYSLGSTILYAMLSAKPEYNEKIILGITMANSVFLAHTRSPPLRFLAPIRKLVELYFYTFWRGEAFSKEMSKNLRTLGPDWCRLVSRSHPTACPVTLWPFDGNDPRQLNHEILPLAQGGTPESTSARIVGHCLQNIAKGILTKYDYGFIKNLFVYGSFRAPIYDLSNIAAPLINYYADNDPVASKADAFTLEKSCPTLLGNFRVNWTTWNHFDYMYAKDADILVYDHMLKYLKEWNPSV